MFGAVAVAFVLGELVVPGGSIIGGAEVPACGWPSVVALDGTCSGTLVHPRVVLYAAHCGQNVNFVTPGEVEADGTPVPATCTRNPDWDHEAGGNDYAVCVLDEPIEDVPIVPILMGCEHQVLAEGVMATSVGFGLAPDGPAGIKRAVTYAIDEVVLDEFDVWAGGAEGSLCDGDSGGGAFVQWIDGSWRLFGIHSAVAGEPCTDARMLLTLASGAVPWIEATTGIDVTPCHDADGTWNPGPDCGEFPMEPEVGGGAWPTCEPGALVGPSTACGPPSYGPDDLAAPTIAIVQPRDGAAIPLEDDTADVAVAIEAADHGWGLQRTWLRIDGVDVEGSEDDFPPWEVPALALPQGEHVLEAVALDWGDNEGVSSPVTIFVGDVPEPEGTTTGDAATTTTPDAPGSETGRPAPGSSEDDGDDASTSSSAEPQASTPPPSSCSCRTGTPLDRALALCLGLLLLPLRRRRGLIRKADVERP